MNDVNTTTTDTTIPPPAAGLTRVTLKHPVTVLGITTTYLDIRRPKVRDLMHADKLGGTAPEKEIAQFAALAAVAPNLIEELDMADYIAIQDTVKGFLPKPVE